MIVNKCVICLSEDIFFLFSDKDQMHRISGQYNIWYCKKCHVLFLHPQPKPEILSLHYPEDRYYSLKGKDGIPGGGDKLFHLMYAKNAFWLMKMITWPLRPFFRSNDFLKKGNYLDIGCGSGHFLVHMQTYDNMDCYGVDSQNFSLDFAKENNLNIFHGELSQANYSDNFFDTITLNHTFEHVANPKELLLELLRILKPNGTVIIGVPQTASLANKIFGKHWAELDIPRHLFVYSTNNLKQLLETTGFYIKKTRYNSNPVSFIMSFIYWSNKWRSKPVYFEDIKWNSLRYSLLFFLFLPICYFCDIFKIGDQVELFATKKNLK